MKPTTALLLSANHRNSLLRRHQIEPGGQYARAAFRAYSEQWQRDHLAIQLRNIRRHHGRIAAERIIEREQQRIAGKCSPEVVIGYSD